MPLLNLIQKPPILLESLLCSQTQGEGDGARF
jgi:hypothetical protein